MNKTVMLHAYSGYLIPNIWFEVYRFKFILFGASCSPFILNATIAKHFDSNNNDVAKKMKTDIYVDNLATGIDSEDKTSTFL